MHKKNSLKSYPAALRKRTKLPKSLCPPAWPSLIGLSDKKMTAFFTEHDAYIERVLAYRDQIFIQNIQILKDHFGVNSDFDLLIKILSDFVPAFQLDDSKPGPKAKWGEPLLIKLAVEVSRIRKSHASDVSDLIILRELSKTGFFKGINLDVLQNQYIKAKKLPLLTLSKSLQLSSEDVRTAFINEIEAAAGLALKR